MQKAKPSFFAVHKKGEKNCIALRSTQPKPSNECAAMVVGDNGYNVGADATADKAIQLGMKICTKAKIPTAMSTTLLAACLGASNKGVDWLRFS